MRWGTINYYYYCNYKLSVYMAVVEKWRKRTVCTVWPGGVGAAQWLSFFLGGGWGGDTVWFWLTPLALGL